MINKISAISFIFLMMFSMPSFVSAQEAIVAEEAGVIPGDILYPAERAVEAIGTTLTFGEERRAERELRLASERALETRQVILRERRDALVERSIERYDDRMASVMQKLRRLAQTNPERAEALYESLIKSDSENLRIISERMNRERASYQSFERLRLSLVERQEEVTREAPENARARLSQVISTERQRIGVAVSEAEAR